MDVPPLEQSETETYPLIMERSENLNTEHIVDILDSGDTSSSNLARDQQYTGSNASQIEDRPSSSTREPTSEPPMALNGSNSQNSSFIRRENTRRRQSPLNSSLWISIELALTLSQIVAAIVVLSLSRHEHPRAPLFQWIVGYASGCVATLPLLYWRYKHRNQALEQDSSQSRQNSTQVSLSARRSSEWEDRQTTVSTPTASNQRSGAHSARLKIWVEYFKMGLDCFFAVWFVVGNVWIFGGHSSASESPNLYRLCIVFLTFSCIGYAMPFILCVTICCCLPCIISILGFREDLSQTRGATTESIDALPTYKFKVKKRKSGDENTSGGGEAGIVAAGTEKERIISGEDAVCCICLAKYSNNDELRELPCSHFFHKDCVDKWLKINALCPLCKAEVGESILGSLDGSSSNHHQGNNGAATTLTLF